MGYGLWQFGNGTGVYKPSSAKVPTENTILEKAVKELKKAYPQCVLWKLHGGDYQRAGIPDLYIAVDGVSVWVEFKRPGADTTALQLRNLELLRQNGVYCGTAESPETLIKLVTDAINANKKSLPQR